MGIQSRRQFRLTEEGFRLEDRVVMSVTGTPGPAPIVAQAVDPLVQPPFQKFKGSYIEQTLAAFHPPFQAFINKVTAACQNDIRLLGLGQNEANLLASLKAYVSLQGGILETQLEQASRRLPGGNQYLFNPPQGTVPGGYPTGTNCGPDLRYYVKPAARIKTQVDSMIAFLNANATSLANACGQASMQDILLTYQGVHDAAGRFVKCAVTNKDFVVIGWS
jgi:hypothetical protein